MSNVQGKGELQLLQNGAVAGSAERSTCSWYIATIYALHRILVDRISMKPRGEDELGVASVCHEFGWLLRWRVKSSLVRHMHKMGAPLCGRSRCQVFG